MTAYLLRNWQLGVAGFLAISGVITSGADRTLAQITPDATLGAEGSVVTPGFDVGGQAASLINGGTIRGTNLFHSFIDLNVVEGQGVYFANPAGIENILTRVTGANPSNILGTLGVIGSNANLFLINPNGIIFGSNARLDVGGSFVGTTANAILFSNGNTFSASVPTAVPTLTVNPSALLFNQISTASIVNQSLVGLQVPAGRSLLLVGSGSVNLNGALLSSAGGQIEIGGLAGAGTVNLISDGNNLSLSFPDGAALADVSLNNALVDASGVNAGTIRIQGNRVTLTDGSRIVVNTLGGQNGRGIFIQSSQLDLSNSSSVSTSTVSSGNAGNILIQTSDSVKLSDPSSFIGSTVTEAATGNGGDVVIEAEKVIAQDGGQIFTTTLGEGQGGNLTIKTATPLEAGQLVVQNGAQISVSGQGVGDAGDLIINADSIYMDNQGRISTATASGNSANIFMYVRDSIILRHDSDIRTNARGTGNGGNITIEAGGLVFGFLSENSDIIASAYQGQGGNITATADAVLGFKLYQNVDTPESDFTASSELGIDGTITIKTRNDSLEVPSLNDFSQAEIAQSSCQHRSDGGVAARGQSRFVITGSGGLPDSPNETLSPDTVWEDLRFVDNSKPSEVQQPVSVQGLAAINNRSTINNRQQTIVEAKAWELKQRGEVVLTANGQAGTPYSSWQKSGTCSHS
jgi:filamentous hemagglutinin family protein